MRNDVLNGSSQTSMTTLLSGILTDIERLLVQQTRLLRLEIREDLRKARMGAIYLAAGLGVTFMGGLLFSLMVPYLLNWLFPALPLWACFAITGFVFFLVGGGVVYAALKKIQAAAALSESVATLKENVTCLLKPK
jgi:uncharacterized membrane protein YqjE